MGKNNIFSYPQVKHRKPWGQHCGCEARWTNPASCKRCVSIDCWRTKPMGQQPGSNSSVRKLRLLIFKGRVY